MNPRPALGALIEANRTVTAPSREDRERNRGLLHGRIGAGMIIGAAAFATRAAAAAVSGGAAAGASGGISAALTGGMAKWVVVSALLVVGGTGVGVYAARHLFERTSAAAPAPHAVASPVSPPVTASGAVMAVQAPDDDTDSSPNSHNPRSNASAASTLANRRFGREVELLRLARTALDSGSPAAALALLDRYSAEFPHARALGPEYEATRVLALCAAGRTAAADQARVRFLETQSGSPLADRVRTACGAR
jgi:hypothetical protein